MTDKIKMGMTKKQCRIEGANARDAARKAIKAVFDAEVRAAESDYELVCDTAEAARKETVNQAWAARVLRIDKAGIDFHSAINCKEELK